MIIALDYHIVRVDRRLRFGKIFIYRGGVFGYVYILHGDIFGIPAGIFLGKLLHIIAGIVAGCSLALDDIPCGEELNGHLKAVVKIAQTGAQRRVGVRTDGIELLVSKVHTEVYRTAQRRHNKVDADDKSDKNHRKDNGKRAVFEFFGCCFFHITVRCLSVLWRRPCGYHDHLRFSYTLTVRKRKTAAKLIK